MTLVNRRQTASGISSPCTLSSIKERMSGSGLKSVTFVLLTSKTLIPDRFCSGDTSLTLVDLISMKNRFECSDNGCISDMLVCLRLII